MIVHPDLLGGITTFGLGYLLQVGWNYVVGSVVKWMCVKRNRNKPIENRYIGFCGLVGKEPDVERGLLVDTGASINIHGADWFERFVKRILEPLI